MLEIDSPRTPKEMEEYFDLRWRILRAPWGWPRGSEKDELEATAHHVTVRSAQGQLLGVGRLHVNGQREGQIRYMATEAGVRRSGVGRAVAARLEELAIENDLSRIVLNARNDAVAFYVRLGYGVDGPGPTLFDEIEHTRMHKDLTPPRARGRE